MGVSGGLSALLTVPTKAAIKPGSGALWDAVALPAGLSISLDPLLYGIGIVIGPRIGVSMLIGALLNFFLFSPAFGESSADFSRWAAVGLMTLPAFTSVSFAFFLKNHGPLPPGFHPKDEGSGLSKRDWGYIGLAIVVAFIATVISMDSIFDISWRYIVLAAVIGAPMCFALGKVASETDINPIRLLAIILLMIFSLVGNFGVIALLGIGIGGAAMAALAVDLFQDLRTGYLINAKPRQQIFVQFLGVIPVSIVSVYFLHLLANQFGFGEGKYFPAPGAVVWGLMAELFAEGASGITPFISKTLLYTSIAGVVMTFLENIKKIQHFAPSPFAMGIALLMPIEMSFAICAGSLVRLAVVAFSSNQLQAKEDAFQAGSAIFAASALAGIVTVTLISMGILYLPS